MNIHARILIRKLTILQNGREEDKMFIDTMKNGNNVRIRHMKICKCFLVILAVILFVQSIVLITNFCYFLWNSSDQIFVKQIGNSVKIQALFGYFQLSSQYIPLKDTLEVSGKVFGASIAAITFLFEKIPLFIILWKITQIFQNMISSPFYGGTCRKIKEIGWIILYFGFLQKLIFQLGVSLICYHKLWFNNPFNMIFLFAGGVILLIGDIFAYGCELQRETDELL